MKFKNTGLLSAVLALVFLAGCGASRTSEAAPAADAVIGSEGVLSYLNISEEEYEDFLTVRTEIIDLLKEHGYVTDAVSDAPRGQTAQPREIRYFDTLDAMLMALRSGDIDCMEVFQSTASYLCSQNEDLAQLLEYDLERERVRYAKAAMGSLTTGFAFMMPEENTALRDRFNDAIAAMTEDGTLDQLVQAYITDVIAGGEIPSAALEQIEGRETVTVAVTGAMPPFDYVSADGKPAGFNTAVLAELGRRLGVNIELLQVDSVGRAAALASGAADAVFWTRSAADGDMFHVMSGAEFQNFSAQKKANFSEEEIASLEKLDEVMSREKAYDMDMPAGTVITDPYYTDVSVPVVMQATLASLKDVS